MKVFSEKSYKEYIHGSAEVVGLMCLKVFCDDREYEKLEKYAISIVSAFQKVNFLRDLKQDHEGLNRSYFPNLNLDNFDENTKVDILKEIDDDFSKAIIGIFRLPKSSRFGVYTAYKYYLKLLNKLRNTPPIKIKSTRIRVPNYQKM